MRAARSPVRDWKLLIPAMDVGALMAWQIGQAVCIHVAYAACFCARNPGMSTGTC